MPVVATFKGRLPIIDDGTLEDGKGVERKVTMSVRFYSLEINYVEHCMVDLDNTIARIFGEDRLETLRKNIM